MRGWNIKIYYHIDGIKIAGRNISNLRYADDNTLMAESEEELERATWWEWKRRVKSWLKGQHSENEDHGIWSHHFMGNRCGNSVRLYFHGLQNHWRWWLQPWNKKTLTPWKKNYDQPRQQVKKKRHYFVNKGPSSQGYGFSSMYRCERWTIKKAEHWRIDAFELWCWRRLLRVSWTARIYKQSILKEISLGVHWKDWCWSWNSNTSATWCEELTHLKRPWCWERLKARGEGYNRGWDWWMASPLNGHEFE